MTEQIWYQLKATVPCEKIDDLCAVMSMIDSRLMIEDPRDIDLCGMYGELADESLIEASKSPESASASVFVPGGAPLPEYAAFLRERMAACGIIGEITVVNHNEEDWASAWKQYYKPVKAGKNVVIVPMWEDYIPADGEIIVRMDPGMAFGTGTHETTRLMIALLEDHAGTGSRVLDVGCGSGILAICAAKLGAGYCAAYDLDPVAVRVARENAAANAADIDCGESDLLNGIDLSGGKFDVVCANIVADIIAKMLPDSSCVMKSGGVLLLSGIITERENEITDLLKKHDFAIVKVIRERGWSAIAARIVS